MSADETEIESRHMRQDTSVPAGEKTIREELQIDVDKLTTSLVELYQTLSPLLQQAQELTAAVEQNLHFMDSWVTLMKEGARSYQDRQTQVVSSPMETTQTEDT